MQHHIKPIKKDNQKVHTILKHYNSIKYNIAIFPLKQSVFIRIYDL
ncbi:protein of unknown function [Maridesulfovibrio hydrothermalis AM13 = DSM 14728]|uniref:Uncharacterized protein n=1 Tax=Maridesulfovibrio hydrothermalis AM13 = DSM 14728 TaxID=1121451 RepID=L0RGE4_9BACT|nr:protein of unknown function [Maridesulfovibrio hydrothermalis AM13 = DSM 14728]